MSAEAPPLIGRNRAPSRVAALGYAVPTIRSRRELAKQPGEKVEPKPAAQVRAEEAERRDAQPVVTRCALCDWFFDGTASEGREQAREHRATVHGLVNVRRTKRNDLRGWVGNGDVEQRDEAMKLVMERRAFTARSEAGLGEATAGRAGAEPRMAQHPAASPSRRPSPSLSRRPSPAQAAILRFLEDGPKRLCEIAAHQGTRMATNGKTLHRLSERGLVVKRGRGVYALADSVRAKAA